MKGSWPKRCMRMVVTRNGEEEESNGESKVKLRRKVDLF
jgi:hypothetical protein